MCARKHFSSEPGQGGTEDGMNAMPSTLGNPQGRVQYEQARHDENLNKLEGVSIHDGIPRTFFNQTWRVKFEIALGQKTQDGFPMNVVLAAVETK